MTINSEIYNDKTGRFVFVDTSELTTEEKSHYFFVPAVEYYDQTKYDVSVGLPGSTQSLVSLSDGWYIAYSMFVPNVEWYTYNKRLQDQGEASELDGIVNIYIIESGQLYKVINGIFEHCEYDEILNEDDTSSVKKKVQNILKIFILQARYISLCRRLINDTVVSGKVSSAIYGMSASYIKNLLGASISSLQYIWDSEMFNDGERIVRDLMKISEVFNNQITCYYETRCLKSKSNR